MIVATDEVQPLRTKHSCYGRRSTGRSSKDSRKEFEGVSGGVLPEQPISRIYIMGRVKLLGKSKLEFISDFSTYLYIDSAIFFDLPTTPSRNYCVSLVLL